MVFYAGPIYLHLAHVVQNPFVQTPFENPYCIHFYYRLSEKHASEIPLQSPPSHIKPMTSGFKILYLGKKTGGDKKQHFGGYNLTSVIGKTL